MIYVPASDNSKNDSNKNEIESRKNDTINQSKNTSSSLDSTTNYYNDFFETFRQNIQNFTNIMEQSWPSSLFPTMKAVSPFEIFDRWTET
jgi:hypothetical protein